MEASRVRPSPGIQGLNPSSEALQTALRMTDKFYTEIESNSEILPDTSAKEIEKAKKDGKVIGLLALKGAEQIMGDIGLFLPSTN